MMHAKSAAMKHMEKIALSGKTGKLADFRHEWKILLQQQKIQAEGRIRFDFANFS